LIQILELSAKVLLLDRQLTNLSFPTPFPLLSVVRFSPKLFCPFAPTVDAIRLRENQLIMNCLVLKKNKEKFIYQNHPGHCLKCWNYLMIRVENASE
jgi:hypothetical protein